MLPAGHVRPRETRREDLRHREERSDGRRQDRRAGPSPGEDPVVRWVLLDGGRPTLAALVSAGVFLAILGLELAGAIGLSDPDLVTAVFGAAITGVVTLDTITVSINPSRRSSSTWSSRAPPARCSSSFGAFDPREEVP